MDNYYPDQLAQPKPRRQPDRFLSLARAAFTGSRDERIQELRLQLQSEFAPLSDAHRHLLTLALDEAEALAFQTAFPLLLFPALAEEKVRALAQWKHRQAVLQAAQPARAFAE